MIPVTPTQINSALGLTTRATTDTDREAFKDSVRALVGDAAASAAFADFVIALGRKYKDELPPDHPTRLLAAERGVEL